MTSKSLKRARQKAQKQAADLAATTAVTKGCKASKKKDWAKVISDALLGAKWQQALDSLRCMREAGQVPKLGAVQRWVRLADLTGREELAALLLDAIMRTAAGPGKGAAAVVGTVDKVTAGAAGAAAAAAGAAGAAAGGAVVPLPRGSSPHAAGLQDGTFNGSVRKHPAWCPPDSATAAGDGAAAAAAADGAADRSSMPLEAAVQQATASATSRCEGRFHIVGTETAPQLATPNPIFMTDPGVIEFDEPSTRHAAARVDVPFVAGAFVLTNVLSRREVAQIVAVSERMGYADDADYTFSAASSSGQQQQVAFPGDMAHTGSHQTAMLNGNQNSNQSAARASAGGERAAGCVWLADDSLLLPVWERVQPLLPQQLGGGALAGINARWRLYRYDQGTVYRPHVDGAWPGSGLRDGKVVFDYFGDRWSRLTFLIYLNDGFDGGSTTFYTPGDQEGILEARGVSPRAGNVLVFPHGDTGGSLVHEGSAVTKGVKYVIRTDVLYMLPPKAATSGRAAAGTGREAGAKRK